MALKDILQQLASVTGYNLGDEDARNYLVNVLINPAAKEIYDIFELRNVNCEQVFRIPNGTQVISLPYYVGSVISVKDIDYGTNITTVDMRIKYAERPQPYPNHLAWYERRREAPIAFCNGAETKLRFLMAKKPEKKFTITVIGQTPESAKCREVITVESGCNEVLSENIFNIQTIETIKKSGYTDFDIFVRDYENNDVSFIPSCLLSPCYTHIEVISSYALAGMSGDRFCQILFRKAFIPMVNDEDVFVAGEMYDQAIYWKSLEVYHTKKQGLESYQLADFAYKKCVDLIEKIADSFDDGKEFIIPFGTNPIMKSYERNII